MNLMDAIMAGSGSPLSKMAGQFGLSEEETATAVKGLLPALTNGMKRNISQEGGMEALLGALNKGGHERFLDDASALQSEHAVSEGNNILGRLFNSKDTSRELARRTAESTGLDVGILKKMLPLVAAIAMGAVKKQGGGSGLLASGAAENPSAIGGLMSLLDADGDGSPVDDLLGLAKKLF